MSKIIFNDASSIPAQKVTPEGGYLKILTLESPETLRQYFSDPLKTRKLTVQERGQTIAEYEGIRSCTRLHGPRATSTP